MFKKINTYIADRLALILSSMGFFWICVFIDLVELVLQPPNSIQSWCNFLSQTLIQLLALPVLAFVSKIEGQKTENTLLETHDEAKAIHTETHTKLDFIISELADLKGKK